MNKKIIYAISIISGNIIGVGFFSLPYIVSKVGLMIFSSYLLFLVPLIIAVNLIFGKLALETPDYKRLPGFAKIYLGKWGERIAFFSFILGSFGVILSYIIVGGQFLEAVFSPLIGGNGIFYGLFVFLAGAFFIYFGIKAIAKIEFGALIFFFCVLLVIVFAGLPHIKIGNILSEGWETKNLFLPYGAIIFSLWGASLIPEAEELLGKDKKSLLPIIPISIIIPLFVYLIFIFVVMGISGPATSETALPSLKNIFHPWLMNLIFLIGFLSCFTSLIAIGLTLKKIFWYDLKLNKNLSWFLTCIVPLLFFLIGVNKFIPLITFIGGVMIGTNAVLILLMYRKTGGKKILVIPLIIIFLGGIVYQIIYSIL